MTKPLSGNLNDNHQIGDILAIVVLRSNSYITKNPRAKAKASKLGSESEISAQIVGVMESHKRLLSGAPSAKVSKPKIHPPRNESIRAA